MISNNKKFASKTEMKNKDPQMFNFLEKYHPDLVKNLIDPSIQEVREARELKRQEGIKRREEDLANYLNSINSVEIMAAATCLSYGIKKKLDYISLIKNNPELPVVPEGEYKFDEWLGKFSFYLRPYFLFQRFEYEHLTSFRGSNLTISARYRNNFYFESDPESVPENISAITNEIKKADKIASFKKQTNRRNEINIIYEILKNRISEEEIIVIIEIIREIQCSLCEITDDFKSISNIILFIRNSRVDINTVRMFSYYSRFFRHIDYKKNYELSSISFTESAKIIMSDNSLRNLLDRRPICDYSTQRSVFNSFYHSLEIFKKIINKYGISNQGQYSELRKKLPGLHRSPKVLYGREWEGWPDTDAEPSKESPFYVKFLKAQEIVKEANITSRAQYKKLKKDGLLINLPNNPQECYGVYFQSWGHFLGTNRIATQKRVYLTYKEASRKVAELGIKTSYDYQQYVKTNPIEGVPNDPRKKYAETGWVNWEGFLTGEKTQKITKIFLSYNEAIKVVKKLKITKREDYRNYVNKNKNCGLSFNPDRFYIKEWKNWGKYLGRK